MVEDDVEVQVDGVETPSKGGRQREGGREGEGGGNGSLTCFNWSLVV